MVLGELAPKNLAIAKAEAIALRPGPVDAAVPDHRRPADPGVRLGLEPDPAPGRHRAGRGTAAGRDRAGARPDHRRRPTSRGCWTRTPCGLLDRGLDFREPHRRGGDGAARRRASPCTADEPLTRVVELHGHRAQPVPGDRRLGRRGARRGRDRRRGRARTGRPGAHRGRLAGFAAGRSYPRRCRCPAYWNGCGRAAASSRSSSTSTADSPAIVSLEDIAEELVGEIRDEDDLPESGLVPGGDGSWVVPARWRLDEVAGGHRRRAARGRRLRDPVRPRDGPARPDPRDRRRAHGGTAAPHRP